MLVVRDIFTAKPGQASALAKLISEVLADEPNRRVLTDLVSTFNTVVLEMEVEDLAAYEKLREKRKAYAAKFREAGYTNLFYKGRREVLEVMKP
ncbi:MAG: hypothetical protein P8181_10520 [bacterium]